jgi:hypothetical protein
MLFDKFPYMARVFNAFRPRVKYRRSPAVNGWAFLLGGFLRSGSESLFGLDVLQDVVHDIEQVVAVFLWEPLDVQYFFDHIGIQFQFAVPRKVVERHPQRVRDPRGHFDGGLYLVTFVAPDHRGVHPDGLGQFVLADFFLFPDQCQPLPEQHSISV